MKRVPVFAYTKEGKSARGSLDFFSSEVFQKFISEGGSIIIRYEGGDINLSVQSNTPSSESETDSQ